MALGSSPSTSTSASSNGRPRPSSARLAERLETLARQVERSPILSATGKALTKPVASLLPTGPVKDVLSGTPLGHPAHPLVTDIPIGAWTSAAFLDLVGLFGGSRSAARRSADTLVGLGVLAALPTAITGLSDLSDEVDDGMLATGAAHALGGVAATGLAAASYVARRRGKRALGLSLSMLGLGALTVAGFLGGHLSYRRGLGLDHNAFTEPINDWTTALPANELAEGKLQQVTVAGRDVVLYRENGSIAALGDRCGHRGAPLHEGDVEGGELICPWHQSRFALADGSVTRGPAVAPQPCYATRIRNGEIELRSQD